jgi:hypothetical protein
MCEENAKVVIVSCNGFLMEVDEALESLNDMKCVLTVFSLKSLYIDIFLSFLKSSMDYFSTTFFRGWSKLVLQNKKYQIVIAIKKKLWIDRYNAQQFIVMN